MKLTIIFLCLCTCKIEITSNKKTINGLRKKLEGVEFVVSKSFEDKVSVVKGAIKLEFDLDEDKINEAVQKIKSYDSIDENLLEIDNELGKIANEELVECLKGGRMSFAVFFVSSEGLSTLNGIAPDFKIFISTDKKLAEGLSTPFPGIYGYNANDKVTYQLPLINNYFNAVATIKTDLFGTMNELTAKNYSISQSPVFYLISAKNPAESEKAEYVKICKSFKNEAKLAILNYNPKAINIDLIGLQVEDLPAIVMITDSKKYKEGETTPQKSRDFIAKYLKNELEEFVLSGEEPADNDTRPVKELVTKGGEKYFNDISKDRLFIFSAPWCGYCKIIRPIVEELGEISYKHAKDKVMIGIMDMTKNEIEEYEVKGYPTIYLAKAKTNEKIRLESNDRSLKGLAEFIRTKGEYGIDLSKFIENKEAEEQSKKNDKPSAILEEKPVIKVDL